MPFPWHDRAVDGALALAPCLRCMLLGKSFKPLPSVFSATEGNDNSIPYWKLWDSSEIIYVEWSEYCRLFRASKELLLQFRRYCLPPVTPLVKNFQWVTRPWPKWRLWPLKIHLLCFLLLLSSPASLVFDLVNGTFIIWNVLPATSLPIWLFPHL